MEKSQRSHVLSIIAVSAYVIGLAICLLLDDPRLRYPSFILGQALASVGFLGILALQPQKNTIFAWLVGIGIGFKVWSLQLPPAFSEDVFRYLYEGKTILWGGLSFPFQHAPAEAPNVGIPDKFMDHAWLRINHPELATIYPPLALLTFSVSALLSQISGLAQLFILKSILLSSDFLIWYRLHRLHPLSGLFWGLCPLTIFEIAREGHVDVLATLGLTLGAIGCLQKQPTQGYLGWLIAAGAKLNGLVMLPLTLRITRRGSWLLIPGLILIVTPYLYATQPDSSGLAAYATRWRSGDGVYALILQLATWMVGGEWMHVVIDGEYYTITRHQVTRALTVTLFSLIYGSALYNAHNSPIENVPRLGAFLLLVLLLLSPTLHPWYLLWIIPLVAIGPFCGRSAAVWLIICAPLLHHPSWLELLNGQWRHLPVVQTIIHAPAWLLLINDLYRLETVGQTR